MTSVNRLTVDGHDYFLPDPVTELREKILDAIRAGGGYVNIPPLRGGPGIDILFSPGMPVTWTRLEIGGGDDADAEPQEPQPRTRNFDSGSQQSVQLALGHRRPEQVALRTLAAQLVGEPQLLGGLDALRDDTQAALSRSSDHVAEVVPERSRSPCIRDCRA